MKTKLLRRLRKKVERRISPTVTSDKYITKYEVRWSASRARTFYNKDEAFDFLQKKEHDLLREELDRYMRANYDEHFIIK